MKSDLYILDAPISLQCVQCAIEAEAAKIPYRKTRQQIKLNSSARLCVHRFHMWVFVGTGFLKMEQKQHIMKIHPSDQFALTVVVISWEKLLTGGTGEIHTALWMLPLLQMVWLTEAHALFSATQTTHVCTHTDVRSLCFPAFVCSCMCLCAYLNAYVLSASVKGSKFLALLFISPRVW